MLFALVLTGTVSLSAQTTVTDSIVPPAGRALDYGHVEPQYATGSVSRLESAQFNQGMVYDWNQLWQGLVPGLSVTRNGNNPNTRFDARIRNLHTFGLNTQPLYVVDGVPGVDIQAIDPSEIASIEVLRDAASAAIYGGRGAAGVVLIRTRAPETGRLSVDYFGQVSIESPARRYTVLDEQGYLELGGTDRTDGTTVNTDWQSEILRPAVSHSHDLRLGSGLWKGGAFRGGLHYRNQQGILRESGFQRYSGNLALTQQLFHQRLTLSAGLSGARQAAQYSFQEAFQYAVIGNPSSPVRSSDPAFAAYDGYAEYPFFDVFNPVAMIDQNRNEGLNRYWLGHLRADAHLLPGLEAGLRVARESSNWRNGEYESPQSNWRYGYVKQGNGYAQYTDNTQDILEATLQYRKNWSRLGLDLLGGYGWQESQRASGNVTAPAITSAEAATLTDAAYFNVLTVKVPPLQYPGVYSREQTTQLTGAFGRAALHWKNTWFLNAGARYDGASQLGENARWGLFPFVGVGVDLARLVRPSTENRLAFRLSYGVTGQAPVEGGRSLDLYSDNYFNGHLINAYLSQQANPDLSWERTRSFTTGLDFTLLDQRLSGSLDWYHYNSSDLMYNVYLPVPPNLAQNQWQNVGEISGHGLELQLNYQAVQTQQINWQTGIALSTAKATLDKTWSDEPILLASIGAPGPCCGFYSVRFSGQTLGEISTPIVVGKSAIDGSPIYKDVNGDGFVRPDDYNDRERVGNGLPKLEMGWQNNLRWRQWDLGLSLRAVLGHDLIHEMRVLYENPVKYRLGNWNSIQTRYFDRNQTGGAAWFDDRHVENASFCRLQFIALGYSIPLPEHSRIRRLRLQIGAQNLFTLTGYTGLDPELRRYDIPATDNGGRYTGDYRDNLSPGIDRRASYFPSRTWWLGVQAGF